MIPHALRLLSLIALVSVGFAGESARSQGIAVTVDGWERSVASTGTTYYRCRVEACSANSAVSYRQQESAPLGPLATLRAQHDALNQRMVASSQGRVARVETIDAGEGEIAGAQQQTIVKTVEFSDGRREFMVVSLVSDGSRRFSIVSTAVSDAAARGNLRALLPMIMLSGHLGGQPAPGR